MYSDHCCLLIFGGDYYELWLWWLFMVTSVESRHKQDYSQSLHCTSSSLQAHWAWLCFSLVKFITHASIIYCGASTINESYFSDDGQSNPLNGLLLWIIDLESSETRGHNGPNSWSLLKKSVNNESWIRKTKKQTKSYFSKAKEPPKSEKMEAKKSSVTLEGLLTIVCPYVWQGQRMSA